MCGPQSSALLTKTAFAVAIIQQFHLSQGCEKCTRETNHDTIGVPSSMDQPTALNNRMEAIAIRLEAIASRLEAIASRLETLRLKAVAMRLDCRCKV